MLVEHWLRIWEVLGIIPVTNHLTEVFPGYLSSHQAHILLSYGRRNFYDSILRSGETSYKQFICHLSLFGNEESYTNSNENMSLPNILTITFGSALLSPSQRRPVMNPEGGLGEKFLPFPLRFKIPCRENLLHLTLILYKYVLV